jgi:Helix-turn-helix domain
MANRRIDPRRIKTHFSYTVEEAADALGVHKNTVRMWIKGGLAVADDRRPTVMSGAAIRAFLENRLKARKSPLKPGEFYCFRCREPKSPAGSGFCRGRRRARHTDRALSRLRNDYASSGLSCKTRSGEKKNRRDDFAWIRNA